MVKKTHLKIFSRTKKASRLNLIYSIRDLRSTKFSQMMILGWSLTFLWQGQICSPIFFYGENVAILEKSCRHLQICNGHFTRVSESWPMGLLFLAHLSTKCSWWAIVVSQCPSSVVRRQQLLLKPTPPTPLGQLTWYLVGCIGVTCRSKISKIVLIGNPRWPPWPPSWKYIFRIISWTERPVDSKLARKHQGDL